MTLPSAFSSLDAPPERIVVQDVARARLLPTCCGTYALYDRSGKLLYIGKAKNVRSRVLSHLRDPAPQALFLRPWTHLVGRVEARHARSETEALLVEADLVGRLRPPFNRRMRSWSRYCYLVPTHDPASPLSVSCELQSWRDCFGPFRTRGQALRVLEAVFVLLSRNGHADRLADCYRLLAGEDTSLVDSLERQCRTMTAAGRNERWVAALPRVTEVLKAAARRAVLLREAREMIGGVLILPGGDGGRTAAVITDNGLHLGRIEPNPDSARAFLEAYRALPDGRRDGSPRCLPKPIADCLCVAAHQRRRHPRRTPFLARKTVSELSARDLLRFVFDDAAAEGE